MGILQASVPNSCWQSSQNKYFNASSKWTIFSVFLLPYQYIHQNTTLPEECFSPSRKRCSEVIHIYIFTQTYKCIQIRCVHILEHSRRRWWWCVHKYPYKHAQPCKTYPKQRYYYVNWQLQIIKHNVEHSGVHNDSKTPMCIWILTCYIWQTMANIGSVKQGTHLWDKIS